MYNINSKVLFTAYNMASALPGQEDVSCHLQAAADECGHTWADGEMQETREFLGQHQQELADAYDEGFQAFNQAVSAGIKADEEREAVQGGEA